MNLIQHVKNLSIRFILFTLGLLFLLLNGFVVNAQTGTVNTPLDFGTFSTSGAGGSITVSPSGEISSTGNVTTLLPISYHAAILSIKYGSKFSSINISYQSNIKITGSKGGTLVLVPTPTGTITVNRARNATVNIGGTLTIDSPSIDPPGTYSGSFCVYCTLSY
jgi:hypothetical protein